MGGALSGLVAGMVPGALPARIWNGAAFGVAMGIAAVSLKLSLSGDVLRLTSLLSQARCDDASISREWKEIARGPSERGGRENEVIGKFFLVSSWCTFSFSTISIIIFQPRTLFPAFFAALRFLRPASNCSTPSNVLPNGSGFFTW